MKTILVVLFAMPLFTQAALVAKAAAGEKTEANPMRKIIGMLQDMAKEIEREGEVEKEMYDKALCACEGGEKSLDVVIAESTAAIEEHSAALKSGTALKAQLEQEVKDHAAAEAQAEEDLSDATTLRGKEHAEFSADEKDNKQNIAALGKAIPAVEEGMGGASLMQMPHMDKLRRFVEVTKYLSSDARSGVLAFLDQGSETAASESVQAPQSGEILGILKSMKDEMEKDLKDLQAQEQLDFNGFQDLKSAKLTEIDLNEKAVIEKEKRIGAITLSLSEGKHALEDAQEELADAQKFLANMKEQCASMEKTKAEREKMRAAEIQAVSDAIKILNDDDALDVFKKSLPSAAFVQKPKVTYDALLQVSASLEHSTHVATRKHVSKPRELMLLATGAKLQLKSPDVNYAAEQEQKAHKDGSSAEKHI